MFPELHDIFQIKVCSPTCFCGRRVNRHVEEMLSVCRTCLVTDAAMCEVAWRKVDHMICVVGGRTGSSSMLQYPVETGRPLVVSFELGEQRRFLDH